MNHLRMLLTADLKVTGHLWCHHAAAVTSWQASSVSLLFPSIPFLSKPQRHGFSNKFSNTFTELDGIFSLNTISPPDATTLMQLLFCRVFIFFSPEYLYRGNCNNGSFQTHSVMGEVYFSENNKNIPVAIELKTVLNAWAARQVLPTPKARHTAPRTDTHSNPQQTYSCVIW